MFRAIILPIFRSTRLCYSLWYNAPTILQAGGRPVTSWVHYTTSCNTQSSAPVHGQNNCPKHVELTGNINKPIFLHLFGCLLIYINDARSSKHQIMKYICWLNIQKSVPWRVAKSPSYIEDARCLKVNLLCVLPLVSAVVELQAVCQLLCGRTEGADKILSNY